MDGMRCRVSVEALVNGFEVEVPDMPAMKKKMADAKKAKGDMSVPYMGDLTKKYAAKTMKEVIVLVTEALKGMPEREFDDAFEEEAAKHK